MKQGCVLRWLRLWPLLNQTRPKQIELFPWEDLARDYPDVPIVHQRDLKSIIADRGMVILARVRPAPLMQWRGPNGELVWASEKGPTP